MTSSGNPLFRSVVVVAVAAAALFCVTDLMRESDQASILTGAWTLFRGGSLRGQAFYNYDKHYLLYWFIALCFRIRAFFGGEWSPVRIANQCVAALFWITAGFAMLWRSGRARSAMFAIICFLLTPTILLNSVYANAAIVSAGLLLLTGALLDRRTRICDVLAAATFSFAVGTRADAILLLPMLVWLRLPERPVLVAVRTALTSRVTWLLAVAGGAAMVTGSLVYSGSRQFGAFFDATFQGRMLKTLGVYTIFGLGPSLPFAALLVILLISKAPRRAFHAVGAICLTLPFLFYALQLYSPRYLVLTALSPLIFSLSRRGSAFLHTHRRTSAWSRGRHGVLSWGVILLLVGIHAPVLKRPSITSSNPTLFPTTDGVSPMGAWGAFMLRLRHADREAVDHNQLLWNAARSAQFEPSSDSKVHVFESPMFSYLELAVTLKGLPVAREKRDLGWPLYSDSRSLMRVGSGLEGLSLSTAAMLRKPSYFVSDVYQGFGILKFNAGGDTRWSAAAIFLNHIFAGNEFRITGASHPESGTDIEGRPVVLFSRTPFGLAPDAHGTSEDAAYDATSALYFLQVPGQSPAPRFTLKSTDPASVSMAFQALPVWMSAGK